jgi:hypothetical protein
MEKVTFQVFLQFASRLCCDVILLRFLYINDLWENVNIVNFLVAWIPFVISILLAFIPDKEMNASLRVKWRVVVIACGLFYSLLLWHQQTLTQKVASRDQEKLLSDSVNQSNQHSDKQIDTVRKDVQGVKGDLKETSTKLYELFVKTGNDLSTSIGKVGKPAPPEIARIQFTIYEPNSILKELPILSRSMVPDKDGNVSVDVTFTNISDTAAEAVDVWIVVCDGCSFAVEPPGYDKPSGIDEHMRHKMIPLLNAGAGFEKTTIVMKLPHPFPPWAGIAFRYSCKTCGKITDAQAAKIVLPRLKYPGLIMPQGAHQVAGMGETVLK